MIIFTEKSLDESASLLSWKEIEKIFGVSRKDALENLRHGEEEYYPKDENGYDAKKFISLLKKTFPHNTIKIEDEGSSDAYLVSKTEDDVRAVYTIVNMM